MGVNPRACTGGATGAAPGGGAAGGGGRGGYGPRRAVTERSAYSILAICSGA